jgi:uncharacterized protein
MIKSIILQQQEEREILLGLPYVERMEEDAIGGYLSTGLIKLISGPRRAGKSVLALQILKGEAFAYLNFDDDLLLKHFEEDAVVQALSEIYGGYRFLLLDEVQNLPGWELWVNKLYRRGVNLVITGSNAKLLSREMASSLTGRFVQITVLPFSFAEVARLKGISLPVTPLETGKALGLLNHYLTDGGFPEAVLNPSILKNYLSTLFDSILLKDILKRFRIRQTQQLYDLASYLLANYTNPYSANQLKADLGFNSVATLQKFLGYLEEPYLFFNLSRYAAKAKIRQTSPVKSYSADNGFIKARSVELSPNYGRLLENLVFVELVRRDYTPGLSLFYYRTRNNREVDFLLRKGHVVEQLIQVCYDISNPKTLKREIDALEEAAGELGCDDLLLLTWDREEAIQQGGREIRLVAAYRWLVEGH